MSMDDYSNGAWWINPHTELPKQKTPCHCGTTITMGKEDHPHYHSDYCPVYKEWILKEKYGTPEKKD
jgi:hypothetical protein